MFKTLVGKFTFFFWLFFLLVTIPIYIFSNYHFKDILKKAEKEKITQTVNTLKPIIAFHISFDQKKQLQDLLESMLEHEDIQTVRLRSSNGIKLFFKSSQRNNFNKTFHYESIIEDPFSKTHIATITLKYSNKHLLHFNNKIFIILVSIFIFAIIVFLISFFYVHNDLKGLRIIAHSLKQYSLKKEIKPIIQPSKVSEIQTIANVANEMVFNIVQYVDQLKLFNVELEKRVKEEILKQKNQERIMIHQSRQAAMGEMVESIAHQWRQPLNIIGIATANLELEYDLGLIDEKKFHEKVKIISLNINHMSDTIDDFRNFLNPSIEMNDFSASKTVKDVLTILDAQFINNKIKYDFNHDLDLLLNGIENEFKQVILVLLSNSKDAIKMQQEEKNIEYGKISISLIKQNSYGIIEIEDNGGGIDTDIMHNVFEPYFSTKFSTQGTGLGLYIARNIIENRMKGKLSVKNIDKGSCFTIRLPFTKDEKK